MCDVVLICNNIAALSVLVMSRFMFNADLEVESREDAIPFFMSKGVVGFPCKMVIWPMMAGRVPPVGGSA